MTADNLNDIAYDILMRNLAWTLSVVPEAHDAILPRSTLAPHGQWKKLLCQFFCSLSKQRIDELLIRY